MNNSELTTIVRLLTEKTLSGKILWRSDKDFVTDQFLTTVNGSKIVVSKYGIVLERGGLLEGIIITDQRPDYHLLRAIKQQVDNVNIHIDTLLKSLENL